MEDQNGPFSSTALSGLLTAVINHIDDALSSTDDDNFEIIGLFLFAFKSITPPLDFDNAKTMLNSRYGEHGPYNVAKGNSLVVTLDRELHHDVMFRQFMRYIGYYLFIFNTFSMSFTYLLPPFRCSRRSFDSIVELIHNHPVFVPKGKKPTRNPSEQLGIFLHYVGSANQHHLSTARECNAGQGSVHNYVNNVTTALQSLRREFVKWPQGERRNEMKESFDEYGFPGCIGLLDGCLFRLVDAPSEYAMSYYTRKKFYRVCSCPLLLDPQIVDANMMWMCL